MSFKPTPKQDEATALIAGPATHILLEGGSRSAKTFECVWAIVLRALLAPGSRHAILRYRFNHVITSIWYDTFPKVMEVAFPDVKYTENKSSWFIGLPGGSEIWFGGLDDKERADKILGNEYATMFFNEVSQQAWQSVETALSRLAQRVEFKDQRTGETRLLRVKALYDQNPSTKGHFTHKIWHRKQTVDGKQLPRPDDYAYLLMNPYDNKDNIAPGYLEQLESGSERHKRRFLRGEYGDDNPSALWSEQTIDRNRVIDRAALPEFIRIVVACDPSGSGETDNADNDEIGIGAVALGTDGKAYVLEDNTVKAGPATWGRTVVTTYDRLQANVVVGEKNFGGAMVEFTIQTAAKEQGMRPIPFKYTVSSRGKHLRAEPVAALYEQNKVCHVGYHGKLEDEMYAMGTNGYTGDKSPNRVDWLVFAITELFPGIVAEKQVIPANFQSPFKARLAFR
ncbi:MAG: phage terminase large subunit [Pseudomonadota bacterium]